MYADHRNNERNHADDDGDYDDECDGGNDGGDCCADGVIRLRMIMAQPRGATENTESLQRNREPGVVIQFRRP